MATDKRVKYIDIARGIAILCIILGHFGLSQVNRVVFTFHVPIFYFITGYFISRKHDVKTFIKDKVRTLLVPYAVTCVATIILAMGFAILLDGETVLEAARKWSYAALYGAGDDYYEPFYIKAIGALWFLWASFWGSVFLRISLEMKKKVRLIFIIALFFVGYWTAQKIFWFPFSIQAGCCATLFMYIGYLVRLSKEIYGKLTKEVKNASVVFALIIWLAFIKNFQSFWLVHCDIGRGIIDIFGSMCGCFVVIMISKFIENHSKWMTKILAYLGKHSLLVLCVHILELNLFPWWYIENIVLSTGIEILVAKCIMGGIRMITILVGAYICSKIKWIIKLFGIKSVN